MHDESITSPSCAYPALITIKRFQIQSSSTFDILLRKHVQDQWLHTTHLTEVDHRGITQTPELFMVSQEEETLPRPGYTRW